MGEVIPIRRTFACVIGNHDFRIQAPTADSAMVELLYHNGLSTLPFISLKAVSRYEWQVELPENGKLPTHFSLWEITGQLPQPIDAA